jgi:hypothetical protein
MSLVNSFETDLLEYLFNNTGLANFGDAAGIPVTIGAGDMFIALHTADPGEGAANQAVSEMTYTGYGRSAAPRSAGGWTVSGNVADNAAIEQLGENSSGSQTSTDCSLGFAGSGSTDIYMIGAAALVVSIGVNPEFAIGALDASLD